MSTMRSLLLALACLAVGGCLPEPPSGEAGQAPVATASPAPAASALTSAPTPPVVPAATASAPTKPFAFAVEAASTGATCEFTGLQLPASTKVYAAGAYGGSRQDFQIDQSGHQATAMQVAVNQPDAPVVLMLGSYEPTVWSIGWTPGTRVVAVLVSGYHSQQVTGLPASVPVRISTYDNKGACGYFYVAPKNAGRLNPIARRVFGRPVDMLYPAHDGKVVVGEPLAAGTALVTDGSARAVPEFRLPNSSLAGQAGLEQGVRDGFLREADASDAAAWVAARRARPRCAADRRRCTDAGHARAVPCLRGVEGVHASGWLVRRQLRHILRAQGRAAPHRQAGPLDPVRLQHAELRGRALRNGLSPAPAPCGGPLGLRGVKAYASSRSRRSPRRGSGLRGVCGLTNPIC